MIANTTVDLVIGERLPAMVFLERVPVEGEWIVFDGEEYQVSRVVFNPTYHPDQDDNRRWLVEGPHAEKHVPFPSQRGNRARIELRRTGIVA